MHISASMLFLLVISHLQLFLLNSTLVRSRYHHCFQTAANYTSNSLFETNLKILLQSLPLNASLNNGFSNPTIGRSPDRVYGVGLCRGDASAHVCRTCLDVASKEIIEECPKKKGAIIWYDYCMLSYTWNQTSISIEFPVPILFYNDKNNSQPNEAIVDARALMYPLVKKALSHPFMFFAGVDEKDRSGFVQCSRDLSIDSCRKCLIRLMKYAAACCEGKRAWRLFDSSCVIRYAEYHFLSLPAPPPTSESDPPAVITGKS